ncbi:MAG: tetratricopeptide repeat protein, partial [Chloroflexi bacterium]|nr:tetratricopeptide repeat protein [Chloroflexota bacterium]
AGRCYEIEQSTPYYPFLDALGALFAGLPASLRDEVPHRWPYLGRLLPELIPTPVMERAREDEQQYLHRAVTGLLIAASQHAPVALMLDDLHWADAASLRLLLHLSRHTRESRVFLLGTSRDVEAGRPGTQPAEPGRHAEGAHQVAPLERALHDLAREDLVRRIAVRRLDRGGTAALVAATLGAAEVPGTIAELVYRHTEGNPFFIKQVVQSLRERGDLRRVNGRWERRESGEIQAPETVRAAVGLRLARLSDTTQEILREASVLGQTFLFDDLQAVGARDEGALEDALEEAGSHGLVQALTADRYGFDHALTRQTVVAELAPRRRRRLHLAAAEAIVSGAARERDRERRAAEIARHFLEADAREEALRWSLRAGDAAGATFAHDEAERHYRTALALAVELEDRAGEAEALVRLGETLITISRQAEALSLEERAAALYRSLGDVMGEGRAAARVAWAHSGLGTFEASLEGLRADIARLQPLGTSPVLAELHATFIYQLMATGRLEEALAGEDRMELLARERGYERYLPAARLQRGFILWRMGRAGEGRAIVEGTLAQLEEVGDLFALSSGVQALASHDRDRGELRRARQHLDRALAINTRRNDPTAIANVLAFTALLEILEGKWADARAHCEEAMSLVEDRTDQPDTAIPMGVLGMLRVRRGDHRDIEAYLARSIAMASAMQSATIVSHMALADYQLQRGRPAAARAGLETMIQHARPRMGPLTWVYPGLARACLLMGDLAAASAALATGAEGAEREGNRVVMVELRELEGELLLRRGRLSEAEAMLALALAEAREIGLPPREARTLMAWATLRARQGKRDEARLSLESALAILERLGARPDVEEARHLLDSLRAGMNVW